MKEFSKSLIDRAYNCYVKLTCIRCTTGSTLCGTPSSFCVEAKFSSLSSVEYDNIQRRTWRCMRGDFLKEASDYYDPLAEEMLANVCLHGMLDKYRIFLEICLSQLFFRLDVDRPTNESVCRTSVSSSVVQPSPSSIIRPASRRRPVVMTLEKVKRSNHPIPRSQPIARESLGNSLSYHHFLLAWSELQLF